MSVLIDIDCVWSRKCVVIFGSNSLSVSAFLLFFGGKPMRKSLLLGNLSY